MAQRRIQRSSDAPPGGMMASLRQDRPTRHHRPPTRRHGAASARQNRRSHHQPGQFVLNRTLRDVRAHLGMVAPDAVAYAVSMTLAMLLLSLMGGVAFRTSWLPLAPHIVAPIAFVALLNLLGVYARPVQGTVPRELGRTMVPAILAAVVTAGLLKISTNGHQIAVLTMVMLPLVITTGTAFRVRAAPMRRAPTETLPPPPLADVDVAAMISHELRTPLATLRLSSELAIEDDLKPEERRHLLGQIARQVTRLDLLVDEVADLFRLQHGQLQLRAEAVDLRALLVELIDDLPVYERADRITLECPRKLPLVPADLLKLRTVLSNLIGNAIKYSAQDAPITVRVRTASGGVRISVLDTGRGIAAEHLPHIFESFYRVHSGDDAPRGYGLGLYIARVLVELHGGHIWAESELGRGSEFHVELPLRSPSPSYLPSTP